ncbi:hypothetical protein [Castellaniella caeni]|uniref:hypothetical protein n=1 Tax=Castellaniella caeni TaxID=266123 RepID=UPI00082F20D3|nr:hypothetical protein [Castellaniella caeni]
MNYVQTPNLLSDALERAYAHSILNESQPLSIGKGLKKIGHGLRRAAKAVGRGIASTINAQVEVRARNMLYKRLYW